MVALPRRRPWKVAKEFATLDHLSGGRMVLGAALGSMDREYAAFGEDPSLAVRARRLDDGLAVIERCWSGEPVEVESSYRVGGAQLRPRPVQRPRIPIWVAGRWPNRAPFRRAARWDGVMPIHADFSQGRTMPPETVAEIQQHVSALRPDGQPFDLAIEGATESPGEVARVGRYADAGATGESRPWGGGAADRMPPRNGSKPGHPPTPAERFRPAAGPCPPR